MGTIANVLRKLSLLFRRGHYRSELDEEMAFHRAQMQKEFEAEGMSASAATKAAARHFGNTTRLKERSAELIGFSFETVVQDLHFALRQLRKNPGFAATAIAVLAMGIGASVAIFGFVDAALIKPLPYADPNRLMSVLESSVDGLWPLSYPDFLDWARMNKSFSSLDINVGVGYLLRSAEGIREVQGVRVSGGFFKTLGVHPVLGRDFAAGENRPGGPNVVILSYGGWLHRFGARKAAIGRTVDLDSEPYQVIGVLPREFTFAHAGNSEFWVPLNKFSPHEKMRTFYTFSGIGRLRDGVTTQAAAAEMKGIAAQLRQQYAMTGRELSASVVPLSEMIVGDVRPILLILLGGVGLLLVIACVNVASLLLVRSQSRRREIAVRGALGATRARLVRQFVTEALLLAFVGGVSGLLFAAGLMRLLARLVPKDMVGNMPFLEGVGINAHTGIFAAAVTLAVALLLAVTPALQLGFRTVANGLADGDRGTGSTLWRRLGSDMVVGELAVAMVLLTGAGLLGRSLYRLLHVPLGFEPEHLATLSVTAPRAIYASNEQVAALYRTIEQRVSALPGVESAGITSMLPAQCNCAIDGITFPGRPDRTEHDDVDERHVSPAYLHTLNATLLRGRLFADADNASASRVALINETLARRYFPGEDPIGQKIADMEGGSPTTWQIVGVVNDVREGPLDAEIPPAEYFPLNQVFDHFLNIAVRTQSDADAMLPLLVSTLHQIDPNLGVSDEATMRERMDATQSALLHRFSAWLVGGFAAMGLLLGVVGLYGVVAYSVSQRTREIGVRMALGAQRGSVYRMILREAGWLTAAGVALGTLCSLGASVLIRKLLFGVATWDAWTLASVAIVLGTAAMLASFIPARRAAEVNPVEALRAE
jgi:macrolide transport system ATP-binding/permease protein